jgi:mannose-1-phosphate guanylyltransferase
VNYALILSGGSGTRLWPLSRRARPKHLVSLAGGKPLLEQTLDRLDGLIPPERRYLITIPEQAPIVRDMARGRAVGIIIEPAGRNNLFPMALSTRMIGERDPEARIVFLPADHSIGQPEKLREALELAIDVAEEGFIVTLGIPPKYPEPNYGHLQKGDEIPGFGNRPFDVYEVKAFREKPSLDVARQYAESADWFWNGGIFIYSAATMLDLISEVQPQLADLIEQLAPVLAAGSPSLKSPVCDWAAAVEIFEAYRTLPKKFQTSIDYALMEKAAKVATIPVDMGWNDLGSFAAFADLIEPDERDNRIAPRADGEEARVLLPGCRNTAVFPAKRTVVCLDCNDLIVVETPDAVLIVPRDSSGQVRDIVSQIRERGWIDLL